MNILNQVPILQVIVPIFASLISALSFSESKAWMISTFTAILLFILGIFYIYRLGDCVYYNIGNFSPEIGIEYKIDKIKQLIIIISNGLLLFLLGLNRSLIFDNITKFITPKRAHLFYSLLLLAHSGYIGIISTNDLFNLYVFIEISSLSIYTLIALGSDPKSLIGAFDYLVIGTIGATLILIAIGLFLSLTGNLNITFIINSLKDNGTAHLYTIKIACIFFITGFLLKIAFFPMHFWMIKTYLSTSTIILIYLSPIATMVGSYVITSFMDYITELYLLKKNIINFLKIISLVGIFFSSVIASKSSNLMKIILYSGVSQICYIVLLITLDNSRLLLLQFVLVEVINKIALFSMITHIKMKSNDLSLDKLKFINGSFLFKFCTICAIIFSSSMPISAMFFTKIEVLEMLFKQKLIIESIILIISSGFAIIYHFKMLQNMLLISHSNGTINIKSNYLFGFATVIIIQFGLLIYSPLIFSYS